MKKNLIYLVLFFSVMSFSSCKKTDDVSIDSASGSKEHFMPLSIGNSWTYDSEYYGEYTISVTGTKEMDGHQYYVLTNSLTSQPSSYMRYEGNKLYAYTTNSGKSLELLVVDEDATDGQEWTAGSISYSYTGMYSYTVKYKAKLEQSHESYTHNSKSYITVKEISLQTTIEDFQFGAYYAAFYTAEELADLKTELISSLQLTAVNQTQYFAKGIGYVNQVSETSSLLNVELLTYTIK